MKPPEQPKYSSVLGDWLVEMGYTHCFLVAGGGSMHLIDGFRTRFTCIPVVHEVTAGIAVEHFNECSSTGRAFALVTTGPGLTNIVTAIAGAYTERRELLVIAGQVKSTDLLTPPLRQRGIQEVDGVSLTKAITVGSVCLRAPIGRAEFTALVRAGRGPHPGPVVIEVCLDVQGARVDRQSLENRPGEYDTMMPWPKEEAGSVQPAAIQLAGELNRSHRPVILLGGLVSRELAWDLLPAFQRLGVPVMTTTSAIDRIPSDAPVAAGRPGSWGGQRSANLLLAQADVVVAIGAQLDLQQTGFNWEGYAPSARLFQVFPCAQELAKGHPRLAGAVQADPNALLAALMPLLGWEDGDGWADYVRQVRDLVPVLEPGNVPREGFLSPFVLMRNLSRATAPDDVLALSSSGGSFTGGLQVCAVAARQFATTSPAFASMGYGLATGIGAALARPGKRVVLVEGDGGFSQNLQELAMVRRNNLPIKIFILENHGYGSIRATQRKFFGGAYVGCDEETGLGFPDWPALFGAFGIRARYLAADEMASDRLAALIAGPEPEAWIVRVDPEQPNAPAVSSRILPDGRMESNPLYQMLPPLDPATQAKVARYLPAATG
jgi:acetolactate synthase-1/2/3 large subunit